MPDAEEIINTVLDEEGVFQPLNIERNYRTAKGMIPKLLKLVGRIPFADDLAAAYYTALDPKTPTKAKAILLAAVAYFVLPIDAVPDVILGLGFTDDAAVLTAALAIVGSHVKERHRRAARRLLGIAEPVKGVD